MNTKDKEYNGLRIRLLKPADLPLLIELGYPTCSFMHGRENVSEHRLRKNFSTFVQEFALEPNNEIYLAQNESGEVVAQLWLHATHNRFNGLKELWIWDLTVAPEHRRQGIGRYLLTLAEQRALEQGCEEMWLLVSEFNSSARELYEESGLESNGRLLMKPLRRPRDSDSRKPLAHRAELGRLRSRDMDDLFEMWSHCEYIHARKDGRENPERFRVFLDRPAPAAFGVWLEGRLVGAVLTQYDREKGWVERLAVHPDCRRLGFAKALTMTAIQSLREKGAVVIAALIEPDNEGSLRVFEACGFRKQPDFHYYAIRYGHEY